MISCAQKKEAQFEAVEFENIEVDSAFFDQIDAPFESAESPAFEVLGRGTTWRTWQKLHRACMKSKWLKSPNYLGASNTMNLGAIVDQTNTLQRIIDTTTFSKQEIASMFNYGAYANCGYSQEVNFGLDVFIQSQINLSEELEAAISKELSTAIKTSKNSQVQVGGWRVNNLIEQNLLDILMDAKPDETGKIRYYRTLRRGDNKILTKVIEIQGFTSEIILDRDISAGLEAKLKEGISASIGDSGMNTKLHYNKKRAITVNSDKTFYVFGEFKKTRSVN